MSEDIGKNIKENTTNTIVNITESIANSSDRKESFGESTDPKILSNSDEPVNDSNRHWQTPKNVKGLASQANKVATMVLNGELNIDTARTYSAIIRTVAQAVTNETNKARFLRAQPDLEFENDLFEDQ